MPNFGLGIDLGIYTAVISSSYRLKELVEDKSIQIEPSELKDELIRINPLIPEKQLD